MRYTRIPYDSKQSEASGKIVNLVPTRMIGVHILKKHHNVFIWGQIYPQVGCFELEDHNIYPNIKFLNFPC